MPAVGPFLAVAGPDAGQDALIEEGGARDAEGGVVVEGGGAGGEGGLGTGFVPPVEGIPAALNPVSVRLFGQE